MAEHLTSMHEVLGVIPNAEKTGQGGTHPQFQHLGAEAGVSEIADDFQLPSESEAGTGYMIIST